VAGSTRGHSRSRSAASGAQLRQEHTVEVDGTAVHVVAHGPAGADHTVVALHGFGVDHRVLMVPAEPVLSSRSASWRRIYLDLPGHGRTPAPESLWGADAVLAVVTGVVERLVEGPLAVMGLSYGAHLARGLASRLSDRVSGLALVVPVTVVDPALRRVPPRVVLERDPALLARVGQEVLDSPDGVLVRQTEEVWAREEIATFPGLALAVVDHAGHALPSEQPALFRALLGQWLERVERGAAVRPGRGRARP